MEDLLPGAEDELALGNGHCERWPEQRGLQVRVSVAIVPSLLVAVGTAGRNELVQNGWQIVLQSRLELDRADGGRAADIENVDGTSSDSRGGHNGRDLLGKIVHGTGSFCHDGNLLLVAHGLAVEPLRWRMPIAYAGMNRTDVLNLGLSAGAAPFEKFFRTDEERR